MKNKFSIIALTILLSSCSVFDWADKKTDDWGRSMPVYNEARRCNNGFCSDRDYQMKTQQIQQQQSAPNAYAPQAGGRMGAQAMPAMPVAPVASENMMMQQTQRVNPQALQMQVNPMQAMQPSAAGMPMMDPSKMSQKDFMTGGVAIPGMMPSPYQEAAQDPRLSAQEANPSWQRDLPPVPEGMEAMKKSEE